MKYASEILFKRFGISIIYLLFCVSVACSGENMHPFRHSLAGQNSIKGELVVADTDVYSVAIEAVINPNISNARRDAWAYLDFPRASEPLKVRVHITSMDGEPVFSSEVVDPKLSSWRSTELYLELAKVKLARGRYMVQVEYSGKSLDHAAFSSNITVIPAYQGK